MKIKELIKILKTFDGNLEIMGSDHMTHDGVPSMNINRAILFDRAEVLKDSLTDNNVVNTLPNEYVLLS